MALSSINGNFSKVGTGQLYLVSAPATITGADQDALAAAYFGLFYQDAAAKKVLKAGVNPYCSLTKDGLSMKIKPAVVEFDYNNGPKVKRLAGIDEASLEFSFYDVDAPHMADVFGLADADIRNAAAAAGKAGRKVALIGANANYNNVVAMIRMPSVLCPGEFDHYIFPLASFVPDIDVKLSKNDPMAIKITMSLLPSPFFFNAAGNGVVMLADTADAKAL